MRYALYFAPQPGSPWAEAGNGWLGRDAERGIDIAQAQVPRIPAVLLSQLTSGARRYGFHATLKAPFHLAPGFSEANLEAMAAAFCQAQRRIAVPTLTVKPLDHFLALRPEGAENEIGALAMRCVSYFDMLRAAPAADHELAARRRRSLSPRQEALVQRWGYPYTEEQYRFHLTVSDDLREIDADTVYALRRAAEAHFAPVAAQVPCVIDRLCIFREAAPGAPFTVWRSFPFGDRWRTGQPASLPVPGRLFFFVGPLGADKDSLLRWVQQRLPDRGMVFARRTVTKPAPTGSGIDAHEAVDSASFWNLAAAGQFAMQWQVDGISYGVRRDIEADLQAGLDVLVNGSREYVPQLQQRYPQARVVWIEADAVLLEERLAALGRESGAALLRRISRASQFPPLASTQVVRIDNNAEIEAAGQQILELLRR